MHARIDECLANLAQGTVCKILGQAGIKPHKVRYYLERGDAEFEQKMAEVLCVYRKVQVLQKAAKCKTARKSVAIQAIATTTPRFAAQTWRLPDLCA